MAGVQVSGQQLSDDGIMTNNIHRKLTKLKAAKGNTMASTVRKCIDYYLERELANEIMEAQDRLEELREELDK